MKFSFGIATLLTFSLASGGARGGDPPTAPKAAMRDAPTLAALGTVDVRIDSTKGSPCGGSLALEVDVTNKAKVPFKGRLFLAVDKAKAVTLELAAGATKHVKIAGGPAVACDKALPSHELVVESTGSVAAKKLRLEPQALRFFRMASPPPDVANHYWVRGASANAFCGKPLSVGLTLYRQNGAAGAVPVAYVMKYAGQVVAQGSSTVTSTSPISPTAAGPVIDCKTGGLAEVAFSLTSGPGYHVSGGADDVIYDVAP